MNQMTRTLVGLAVLLVVGGGLALYAWQGVYEADRTEEAKKDSDARLFATPTGPPGPTDAGAPRLEFRTLTITADAQTTVLERGERGWRITSPVQARADAVTVDTIVSQLQTSRFKATLEENPDAETLKRYGLDAPRFTVKAEAVVGEDNKPTTVTLVGGIENTFDGSVYMRRNDDPRVYAAEGGVRYAMAKSTFELRDKQPLAVEEEALQRIAVKSRANEWTVERADGGAWAFTRPVADLADPTQVSAMVGSLSSERALGYPTPTPALLERFNAPALDATLGQRDGGVVHLRFARASEDGGSDLWLALREDPQGTVLAELGSTANQLDRNWIDLRDRSVLRFEKDLVTRVELATDAGTVVVARQRADSGVEGWTVLEPRPVKAKGFKVAAALWALGGMRAASWGEEKPRRWAQYGIDGASRSVVLKGEGGAELARLTVGKDVPGKASTVFVRGTRDQVAEVDSSRFGEVFFSLAEVADEEPVDGGIDGGP